MECTLVAIDFETANNDRDSACAIGLVKVVNGEIIAQEHRLINPQTTYFIYADHNKIRPKDVKDKPLFDAVWAELSPMLDGAEFIAAHNAPFDQAVLYKCCAKYKIKPPEQRFVCTLQAARDCWKLRSPSLNNVCDHLGIELNHHQALSDATACAKIVIKAKESGYKF